MIAVPDVKFTNRCGGAPASSQMAYILPAVADDTNPKRQRGRIPIPRLRFGLVWKVSLSAVGGIIQCALLTFLGIRQKRGPLSQLLAAGFCDTCGNSSLAAIRTVAEAIMKFVASDNSVTNRLFK